MYTIWTYLKGHSNTSPNPTITQSEPEETNCDWCSYMSSVYAAPTGLAKRDDIVDFNLITSNATLAKREELEERSIEKRSARRYNVNYSGGYNHYREFAGLPFCSASPFSWRSRKYPSTRNQNLPPEQADGGDVDDAQSQEEDELDNAIIPEVPAMDNIGAPGVAGIGKHPDGIYISLQPGSDYETTDGPACFPARLIGSDQRSPNTVYHSECCLLLV
jgi:hypothetical protein